MAPRILSQADLARFNEEGYIHARGVVPPEAIEAAKRAVGGWCDRMIRKWVQEGLLDEAMAELDMGHRLVKAWNAAGRPRYSRSPRTEVVGRDTFTFLTHPALLDLASDLLGTDAVAVNGAFNSRPKLPDQRFTDTPWHQDAQYFRDECEGRQILTVWVPLQPVTEANSCLQVAPGRHRDPMPEDYDDGTGFLAMPPDVQATLEGKSIEMDTGDALAFAQFMPHRAMSNTTDTVRWSMDVRYEPVATFSRGGQATGLVARNPADPSRETGFDAWLAKWGEQVPAGGY